MSEITADTIIVELGYEQIRQLTDAPGCYEGTVSIIDSENVITREDYELYDLITVQPFLLDVEKSA